MIKTKAFIKASKARYALLTEVLFEARSAKGISQTVMASALGCAQTQVSRVERGSDVPDVVEFLEWCRVLDLEPGKVIKQLAGV